MASASEARPTRDEPIQVPWGFQSQLALQPPKDWPDSDVVWPDVDRAIGDYPRALEAAINRPLGGVRLEDHAGPRRSVAIVVDDPSRWTPVQEALPVVLRRLHACGIRPEDVTISAGVGRHQAVDAETMSRRVGPDVARAYRCFSPPVDDRSAYWDLGETTDGLPVRVFKPVAEADLRILIGSVLPHLQAGFGGGYKLIFPGTSHRSTLGALHRVGLGGDADTGRLLGGPADANPMRLAIRQAAEKLGPCLSISHVLGAPGQVFRVETGHPDPVQEALATEVQSRYRAPDAELTDLVVAGNYPWPGDPMQSFKVLLNHRAAGKRGGVLVGLFWTDPSEIARSFPLPALKGIAASGAAGGWVVRRGLTLADRLVAATSSPASFMVRWARELVVDRTVLVYAPPLTDRLGPRLGPIRLFNDQQPLWDAATTALKARGVDSPIVRVFPLGGLSYCGM